MNGTIVPIQTEYKGYKFRSRLEARWAVFFDALGVKWVYEPEGYILPNGERYLPDFYLETVGMFAEVKPEKLTQEQENRTRLLANITRKQVLLLVGVPEYKTYWAIMPSRIGTPYCIVNDCMKCSEFECYEKIGKIDYLLDDQYIHSEKRWYCSPGLSDGESAYNSIQPGEITEAAYRAARSARFEHGENPA